MAVRCSKCGEELLGAVNRCWKCGQAFSLRPEIDGRPPVRAAVPPQHAEPLEAIVIADQEPLGAATVAAAPAAAVHRAPVVPVAKRIVLPRGASTAERIDAYRMSMIAMGGTVASLVLGTFTSLLATLWPPAAMVAVLGLLMGIWGLYSPRRSWALAGMLLCCLAIGIGTYGGVRSLNDYLKDRTAITIESDAPPEPEP